MATLVYKFGARRPTTNAHLVDEQMTLAHRYYNRLIEIERERRVAVRAVLGRTTMEIDTLHAASETARAELAAAISALKEQRKETRSRSDTAEQRARVTVLRGLAREAYAAEKAARAGRELDVEAKAALTVAEETARNAQREARRICGVFWGTYLKIEAAADAARKAPLWHKGEPSDPHFRRWRGEGSVSMQVQHGVAVDKVMSGSDTRLQLSMDPPRGESKSAQKRRFGTLRLRVGSEGRDPVWAEWPILMHRPLPDAALIMWATVKRTMDADHDRWELHLTLRLPEDFRREACGQGALAVNFGWRKMYDGSSRVAYWRDEDGEEGEIRENPRVLSGLRKVEELHSIRDKSLNELKLHLRAWMDSQESPPWLRESAETLALWRSPARFGALRRQWAEQRWPGDEDGWKLLDDWWRDDLHLWRWETNQRRKSLERRLDGYRVEAARLARRYNTLVVEDFDLGDTQRHHLPEDDEPEIPARRLQQKDAACSELRTALEQAFVSRGGRMQKVPASLNTQRCALCGCEERWDAAPSVDHICTGCGAEWDQDSNNTKNILERFRESCERSDAAGEVVAKRQGKWARVKRNNRGAREGLGNLPGSLNV